MGNKLTKLLMAVSGAFLVGAGMLGLKIQKSEQEKQALRDDLSKSLESAGRVESMIEQQNLKETERLQKLSTVDKSMPGSTTQTKVQTVVIPGKVVPKTTTKTSTSKTTKTS